MPTPKAVTWTRAAGASTVPEPTSKEIGRARSEKTRLDAKVASVDPQGINMMFETCLADNEPWAPSRLKKILVALAKVRKVETNRARFSRALHDGLEPLENGCALGIFPGIALAGGLAL